MRLTTPAHIFKLLLISSSLCLYGCGDTSDGPSYQPDNSPSEASSSSNNSSDSNSSTDPASASSAQSHGSASSVSSVAPTVVDPTSGQGIIAEISASTLTLPPRTPTEIRISFTNNYGEAVNIPSTPSASSNCITANNASVTFSALSGSEVTATYEARTGCIGDDRITFSGDWNGAAYTVELTLNIEKDPFSNIEWLSTEPAQISIRGSGGQESATITFALRGYNGENIVGEQVSFQIDGAAGGASLSENTGVSDENGEVSVRVRAGTAPSNVIVLATYTPTGETTPSSNLVVASGIAIEGNVTLATSAFNPLGFARIGTQSVTLTVNATDRSGNPVPDGTSVNFISEEGGNIMPNCTLSSGSCFVTFSPNGLQPANGKIQIFAAIKGGEGFIDNNGNKIFDDGDTFTPEIHEKGEPYSDNNNNGQYDPGEHFADTNNDGSRTEGNNLWSGPNCRHSTLCDTSDDFIDLGVQMMLILSDGRSPTLCNPGDFAVASFDVRSEGNLSLGGLYLSDGNTNASSDSIACPLGNPLPVGTAINFKAGSGRIIGNASWTIVDTYLPTGPYSVTYKAPEATGLDVITLEITPPLSPTYFYQWDVNVGL